MRPMVTMEETARQGAGLVLNVEKPGTATCKGRREIHPVLQLTSEKLENLISVVQLWFSGDWSLGKRCPLPNPRRGAETMYLSLLYP